MQETETTSDPAVMGLEAGSEEAALRSRPPVVTLGLVGANCLMALGQLAASGFRPATLESVNDPADWALGAKVPSLVAHGEYWRLITASFLHASIWPHLVLNMLGLLAVGRLVETFYGPARMLVIYVLSAVAGTLASYYGTPAVSLGASTGVLGLMGALVVHNLKYRRYLSDRLNSIYPLLVVVLMILFMLDAVSPHVDLFGHAGGCLGGMFMAVLLESRIAGAEQDERDWLPLPTAVATAVGLLAFGAAGLLASLPGQVELLRAARTFRPEVRIPLLQRVLEKRPYFLEAHRELAELYVSTGEDEAAQAHFKPVAEARPELIQERFSELAAGYLDAGDRLQGTARTEAALRKYKAATFYARQPAMVARAYNSYAWTLVDTLDRDYQEGLRAAELAMRAAPTDPEVLDTLAWAYFKLGRLDEAQKWQQKALEGVGRTRIPGPSVGELYFHMGAIYERLGKKDDAIAYFARALRARGTYPQAEEALRRLEGLAPRLDPSTPTPMQDPAIRHGIL